MNSRLEGVPPRSPPTRTADQAGDALDCRPAFCLFEWYCAPEMSVDGAGEEGDVTREQVIGRLRAWAARAQSEANYADNPSDVLNWIGQAQVLGGIAEFLTSQGSQLDPDAVRLQVISGRQKSIGAWDLARNNPRDLALHAGEVAAYDLILALLKDAGQTWAA